MQPQQLVQMLCALSQALLLMLFEVLPHRHLLHAPKEVPLMEQALHGPGEPLRQSSLVPHHRCALAWVRWCSGERDVEEPGWVLG